MSIMVRTRMTKPQEVLACPYCDGDTFPVGHLSDGAPFGPWYCDKCGGSFAGKRVKGMAFELQLRAERKVKTIDVLVLPPMTLPVYFVVEGMRFELEGREEDDQRFFYEEHSCPTNWLQPEMVYYDGNADPHGLIKFVSSCDAGALPPDEPVGPNAHDDALIGLIEAAIQKENA